MKGNVGRRMADGDKFLLLFSITRLVGHNFDFLLNEVEYGRDLNVNVNVYLYLKFPVINL